MKFIWNKNLWDTKFISFNEYVKFYCYSSGSGGKILVSNLPAHARFEDVENLFAPYGQVQTVEKISSRDPNTQAVLVSYESQDQAQQ